MQEEVFLKNKNLVIKYLPEERTVLISATSEYIPEDEFKEAFNEVKGLVGKKNVDKFVFDKSQLKVFHQRSMTWYHVVWKKEMKELYGITKHIKILPDDDLFKDSVNIGREKIARENPGFSFNDYQIQYRNSLDDALQA